MKKTTSDKTKAFARVVAVIPARYASTRFPGKPLALIAGVPMIQRVYDRVKAATSVAEVLVATDDERIARAVRAFGGRVAMTSPDHASGTDRIAEAVTGLDADLIVNVQGDEPLLPPQVIDRLVAAMRSSQAEMGTVAVPFAMASPELRNPNVVKVVVTAAGSALYFSRAPIPFLREGGEGMEPLWHWGIYAYRREFLEQFVRWPQSRLEKCEKLEQLRALENGARIQVLVEAGFPSAGVDVPADVPRVEQLLREQAKSNTCAMKV